MEFALILPGLAPWIKAVVLGLGKATGALAIFGLGLRVEDNIRRWSAHHPLVERGVNYAFGFVKLTRWVGLLVLLSIPFMPDTLPIYIYSIFNREGQAIRPPAFIIVNFVAGVVRAGIFLTLLPPPSGCP